MITKFSKTRAREDSNRGESDGVTFSREQRINSRLLLNRFLFCTAMEAGGAPAAMRSASSNAMVHKLMFQVPCGCHLEPGTYSVQSALISSLDGGRSFCR
jgi:hypothetical protein